MVSPCAFSRHNAAIADRILQESENPMLRLAVLFLVIALLAAIFGFTDLAAGSAYIARILFFLFLVLFVIALVLGRRGPRAI